MKLLFTLVFALLAAFTAQAQGLPADSITGKIVYRGALPIPANVTQAQAFGRAKIWLADAFASKEVLADDAASGQLSGAGSIKVQGFTYLFRVRLRITDSGVRYRLDDFTFTYLDTYSHIVKGIAEEQRDSNLFIGKGTRAKMLAELDTKVRASLIQLKQELIDTL